jgi:hypothetical protein
VNEDSAWTTWEALRTNLDPDPIEILQNVAHFQKYFSAIERQAIRAARAQGHTWAEIGSALGKTRQAIWQRVGAPRSEDLKRVDEEWWARSAAIHLSVGASPP